MQTLVRSKNTASIHQNISEIPRASWNSLLDADATPFLKWEWLAALEESGCVTEKTGWAPRHLAIYENGELVAAAPAYIRSDSDGDFSQDWGWAEGAARAGISYYPKFSITVPFTPVAGRRLLGRNPRHGSALLDLAEQAAAEGGCSGVQVLFTLDQQAHDSWFPRHSFQFHWKNHGYATFDEFLGEFDSKRRNQLKRECRAATEQGISIRTVRGDELKSDPEKWAGIAYHLHRSTLEKLMWGRKWLSLDFYRRVFSSMPQDLEMVIATRDENIVAGAFNVATRCRLYGRYWGCHEEHPFLHFNVCLYHSIDECIALGREAFEGGAGGQHKLSRGFEPAETHSLHRVFDRPLEKAIRTAVTAENAGLDLSLSRWREESPVLKRRRSL